MAYATETILTLVKFRLNRRNEDTSLDEYLMPLIEACEIKMQREGIAVDRENTADVMDLVDRTVWEYHNRDQKDGKPDWMKQANKTAFLHKGVNRDDP